MYSYISKELEKIKCDYWDARIENANLLSLSIENSDLNINKNYFEGIGIRILNNGSWGFASINQTDKTSFDIALKNALRLSKIKSGNKIQIHAYKKQKYNEKRENNEVDLDKWTKKLIKLEKEMKHKNIISTAFGLMNKNSFFTFINSEGSLIEKKEVFSYAGPKTIGKKGKIMQTWSDREGKLGSLENLKNLDTLAINSKKKVLDILKAKPCPKGIQTVVLDPHMVGVFCHEAIGHASEADIVSKGDSILEKYKGKQIGNPEINIIDSPNEKEGFGNIIYDDEGIKAKKVVLIKNGKVNEFMHSRETAKKFNTSPTGNARATNYFNFPIVRMRNTVMLPGKASKEDIFDIKEGIYLKGMKGGQVKTLDGTFMFAAREGFKIKNGEIKEQVRDVSIASDIQTTLHNIELIGKDYTPNGVGFCGKGGQNIRAGDGGPHIKINKILLG
ncbi:MAG: TldD/PmbA family protein [Candidatus Micrarchaeia archaeon]|jgi:TldD protein